jgi:predicted RNase H-like HicB family nuclease
MTGEFSIFVERDSEGWYVASVPELPGCHTQAKSLDKVMERIREAIELCLLPTEAVVVSRFPKLKSADRKRINGETG